MHRISIQEFKHDLEQYLDGVVGSSKVFVVAEPEGDEGVVILSQKEFNSKRETGHLLSTAANRQRLQRSIDEMNGGRPGSGTDLCKV